MIIEIAFTMYPFYIKWSKKRSIVLRKLGPADDLTFKNKRQETTPQEKNRGPRINLVRKRKNGAPEFCWHKTGI